MHLTPEKRLEYFAEDAFKNTISISILKFWLDIHEIHSQVSSYQ